MQNQHTNLITPIKKSLYSQAVGSNNSSNQNSSRKNNKQNLLQTLGQQKHNSLNDLSIKQGNSAISKSLSNITSPRIDGESSPIIEEKEEYDPKEQYAQEAISAMNLNKKQMTQREKLMEYEKYLEIQQQGQLTKKPSYYQRDKKYLKKLEQEERQLTEDEKEAIRNRKKQEKLQEKISKFLKKRQYKKNGKQEMFAKGYEHLQDDQYVVNIHSQIQDLNMMNKKEDLMKLKRLRDLVENLRYEKQDYLEKKKFKIDKDLEEDLDIDLELIDIARHRQENANQYYKLNHFEHRFQSLKNVLGEASSNEKKIIQKEKNNKLLRSVLEDDEFDFDKDIKEQIQNEEHNIKVQNNQELQEKLARIKQADEEDKFLDYSDLIQKQIDQYEQEIRLIESKIKQRYDFIHFKDGEESESDASSNTSFDSEIEKRDGLPSHMESVILKPSDTSKVDQYYTDFQKKSNKLRQTVNKLNRYTYENKWTKIQKMQNQKIKKEKQLIHNLFEKHIDNKRELGKSENHLFNEVHNIVPKIDTNISSIQNGETENENNSNYLTNHSIPEENVEDEPQQPNNKNKILEKVLLTEQSNMDFEQDNSMYCSTKELNSYLKQMNRPKLQIKKKLSNDSSYLYNSANLSQSNYKSNTSNNHNNNRSINISKFSQQKQKNLRVQTDSNQTYFHSQNNLLSVRNLSPEKNLSKHIRYLSPSNDYKSTKFTSNSQNLILPTLNSARTLTQPQRELTNDDINYSNTQRSQLSKSTIQSKPNKKQMQRNLLENVRKQVNNLSQSEILKKPQKPQRNPVMFPKEADIEKQSRLINEQIRQFQQQLQENSEKSDERSRHNSVILQEKIANLETQKQNLRKSIFGGRNSFLQSMKLTQKQKVQRDLLGFIKRINLQRNLMALEKGIYQKDLNYQEQYYHGLVEKYNVSDKDQEQFAYLMEKDYETNFKDLKEKVMGGHKMQKNIKGQFQSQ